MYETRDHRESGINVGRSCFASGKGGVGDGVERKGATPTVRGQALLAIVFISPPDASNSHRF